MYEDKLERLWNILEWIGTHSARQNQYDATMT